MLGCIVSIYPTPSMYKSFHSSVEDPKSLVLVTVGINPEFTFVISIFVMDPESIWATPSTYKSFHSNPDDPKS